MKRNQLLLILFMLNVFVKAQSNDSTSSKAAVGDNVNVSAMVTMQIQKAMEKQARGSDISPNTTERSVQSEKREINSAPMNLIIGFISAQPVSAKLFSLFSAVILLMVIGRRVILGLKTHASLKLKSRIQLLRNDKIRSKNDPKLRKSRKKLCANETLFNRSEKHVSKKARELNIAKGELFLAARLKFFEVGRM